MQGLYKILQQITTHQQQQRKEESKSMKNLVPEIGEQLKKKVEKKS
jgi:hypothetical protein